MPNVLRGRPFDIRGGGGCGWGIFKNPVSGFARKKKILL